jgi:hypothetical protein
MKYKETAIAFTLKEGIYKSRGNMSNLEIYIYMYIIYLCYILYLYYLYCDYYIICIILIYIYLYVYIHIHHSPVLLQ